jgi:S1-C subfamily serine protease
MIMRRFSTYVVSGVVAFLLAVVLASGSRFNAPTFDASSVVMIMNGSHHGSGFHIGGGKILTAAHVVDDGDTFPVLIESKGTVRTVDGKVGVRPGARRGADGCVPVRRSLLPAASDR